MTFEQNSGIAKIKESVYDKLFTTTSEACIVDEYEIADIEDSTIKLANSVVTVKNKNIEIDTSKFPKANATYYFILIGEVSKLNGTKGNFTFEIYIKESADQVAFVVPEPE